MADTGDVDLLARVRQGDTDALGLLYDKYGEVLFPLALRILRDRHEAEDALHDAFLTVKSRAARAIIALHHRAPRSARGRGVLVGRGRMKGERDMLAALA